MKSVTLCNEGWYEDLAMKKLGCNIVDTYFHTSARTGPTGPNKQDFLLHERARVAPFLQVNSWDQRVPLTWREPSFEPKTLHSPRNKAHVTFEMLDVEGQILIFMTWIEVVMMHNVLDDLGLCCVWVCGDLVHEKFGTRYSGHLLSRLAVSVHNMTKQSPFPTIWREHRKSIRNKMSLRLNLYCLVD